MILEHTLYLRSKTKRCQSVLENVMTGFDLKVQEEELGVDVNEVLSIFLDNRIMELDSVISDLTYIRDELEKQKEMAEQTLVEAPIATALKSMET